MSEPAEDRTIERVDFSQDETAFDNLKRDGLSFAQLLSGKVWTDYNLHDPGVTILEQFCYGLTELIYACDFETGDYLTREDGVLDLKTLALHPPEEAFPCRPTTLADYRCALLNALWSQNIFEVANLWVYADSGGSRPEPLEGLYWVELQLAEQIGKGGSHCYDRPIKEQVLNTWLQMRSLGEDIGGVLVVTKTPIRLYADIEIAETANPNQVTAEIYYECAQWLMPPPRLSSLTEQKEVGVPVERVFEGPPNPYGILNEQEHSERQVAFISTLRQRVLALEGVTGIKTLHCENEQGERMIYKIPKARGAVLESQFPISLAETGVSLWWAGDQVPISFSRMSGHYKRLKLRKGWFTANEDASRIYPRPQPSYRDLASYYGIQNQFPAVYGVSDNLYHYASPMREKGKINQLKGYLMLFEQIMANFKGNLANLRVLFSTENNPDKGDTLGEGSYAFVVLNEGAVRGIGPIYPENPQQSFKGIMVPFDDYFDRKGRVLDYLLALYGEVFSQEILRKFHDYYNRVELESQVLIHKIAYLKDVIAMTRDRAGAANYAEENWLKKSVSGFQRKLRAHLGMVSLPSKKGGWTQYMVSGLLRLRFRVISDQAAAKLCTDSPDRSHYYLHGVDPASVAQFVPLPLSTEVAGSSLADLRKKIIKMAPFTVKEKKYLPLPESLMARGVDLRNYKLVKVSLAHNFDLVLKLAGAEASEAKDAQAGEWLFLGSYTSRREAVVAGNALRRFLAQVSLQSESLHIVEHILLRPQQVEPDDAEFYSLRVSLVFPAWTSRCRNPDFRVMAEQLICELCPAHLWPSVYWLEFNQMWKFENLYHAWVKARQRLPYLVLQDEAPAADQGEAETQTLERGGLPQGQESKAQTGGKDEASHHEELNTAAAELKAFLRRLEASVAHANVSR